MDYSEHYRIARMTALSQGIRPDQFEKAETWYYDETDNVKHLVYENKRVNASENTIFVLGGIQAEDSITDDELHSFFGKEPGKELKANKDLRGTFSEILRKEAFSNTLKILEEKGWNIHFISVQVWYYGFVDIVDSINDDINVSFALKAILYKILKSSPDDTVRIFGRFHYPNIMDKDKNAFLDELITLSSRFVASNPNVNDEMMTNILIDKLEKAKTKKQLVFIQDETPDEWVGRFIQFYSSEIASYPNKTLILDTEKQVEKALKEVSIEVNGKVLKNYSFVDSDKNPMIQVCDYVVSILRKYFIFLDRSLSEVIADIKHFDEQQLKNLKFLNRILKRSLDANPLYYHYITSVEMQYNLNQLMNMYC